MLWYGNICVSYYKVRIPRTMRLYSYFTTFGTFTNFLGYLKGLSSRFQTTAAIFGSHMISGIWENTRFSSTNCTPVRYSSKLKLHKARVRTAKDQGFPRFPPTFPSFKTAAVPGLPLPRRSSKRKPVTWPISPRLFGSASGKGQFLIWDNVYTGGW